MSSSPGGWRHLLGTPGVTRWLWLAALAFSLPALGLGHVLDDLQQQAMLKGTYDSAVRTAAELYCFSLGPGRGLDPSLLSWWDHVDSSLCFLRPISSWSLWIDHAFFWELPAITHLHSVLWLMGLWFGWRRILLRYLPTNIANLALLLAAAAGFVSLSIGWIAARHALVGGCLSVWGLHHCLAGHDETRRRQEWFGLALIGIALLSSEMALGAFGFLIAREGFTGWQATPRRRGGSLRIACYATAGLAYVAVHSALGYGAPKYPLYLDPLGDPLTFLRAAPERLLGLTGELVLGLPSELWLYPWLRPTVAIISGFAAVMLALSLRGLWRVAPADLRQQLGWLGLGALFSLAPCVSGMQGGRALTIAGFPLLAMIAACLVLRPSPDTGKGWLGRRLQALPLATLAAGALVGNPLVHMGWFGVVAALDHAGEGGLDEAEVSCPPASDVYLIDASQLGASAWYARFWLKSKLGASNFRQLTMIPTGITGIEVSRTGASNMTLRALEGTLVGSMAVPRGSQGRIQPGFERRYPDYRVSVTGASQDGPTEVAFGFTRTLDAPELCLFVHDDTRLYQIAPPPVGHSLVIRPQSPLAITPAARPRSSRPPGPGDAPP